MYTLSVYAVCVGLTFMIGTVLFAGCTALLMVKELCLMLAEVMGRIPVRARPLAARSFSAYAILREESSDRGAPAQAAPNHRLFSSAPRGLIRTQYGIHAARGGGCN